MENQENPETDQNKTDIDCEEELDRIEEEDDHAYSRCAVENPKKHGKFCKTFHRAHKTKNIEKKRILHDKKYHKAEKADKPGPGLYHDIKYPNCPILKNHHEEEHATCSAALKDKEKKATK